MFRESLLSLSQLSNNENADAQGMTDGDTTTTRTPINIRSRGLGSNLEFLVNTQVQENAKKIAKDSKICLECSDDIFSILLQNQMDLMDCLREGNNVPSDLIKKILTGQFLLMTKGKFVTHNSSQPKKSNSRPSMDSDSDEEISDRKKPAKRSKRKPPASKRQPPSKKRKNP